MKFENSISRIIVALIFIPVLLGICYLGGLLFTGFVVLIATVGYYEIKVMLEKKKIYISNLGYIITIILVSDNFYNLINEQFLVGSVLILLIIELFRNNGSAINNLAGTFLGLIYPGFLASYLINLREYYPFTNYDNGGFLIITIFIALWLCDSGAYFIGSAIGKHKLFPRVSPKKSWEGAIAGFLFAIAGTLLSKFIFAEFLSIQQAIVIGVIIGTIGQIGDLAESLLKRDAGVKDSSNIIPGHGGILDRFDSLLFCAPAVYLYLTLA